MKRVVFIADAVGQALNCVAIALELKSRDYDCICVADQSFSGLFSAYGLQEYLIDIYGLASGEPQVWSQHVASGHAAFHLSTLEQIDAYIAPYWGDVVDGAISAHTPLTQALNELQPDLIVVDDVIAHPAIIESGIPWVRLISCNELEISDPALPPALSGYSINDNTGWAKFRERYKSAIRSHHQRFNQFLTDSNIPALDEGVFMPISPTYNFMIYPQQIAYTRSQPLPENCIYLNACIRKQADIQLAIDKDRPNLYITYGSMGAVDKELIHSQLIALAKQPYVIFASVGDNLDYYQDLPRNVHVSSFYPQPALVKQIDLVIHHGGNNTFNEALYFGKPQIVLPFAWDGYDNAMRLSDLQLGISLNRYRYTLTELEEAVQHLLADNVLSKRLSEISQEMQERPGAGTAAELIHTVM